MTTDELQKRTGLKLAPKVVFVLAGPQLFGRDGDSWFEYPPYPQPQLEE